MRTCQNATVATAIAFLALAVCGFPLAEAVRQHEDDLRDSDQDKLAIAPDTAAMKPESVAMLPNSKDGPGEQIVNGYGYQDDVPVGDVEDDDVGKQTIPDPDSISAADRNKSAGGFYMQGDPNLNIWEANAEMADAASVKNEPTVEQVMTDIGGGTGATVGGTGDIVLDRDLLRRMRYQDKAVMCLLLLAYTGSLAFSASLAYRQAANDSPVTYYADPRFYNHAVDTDDLETFLDVFNQPPKDVQLQVSGLLPLPPLPEYADNAAVEWLGTRYRAAFSFALDLSPWVVRHGEGSDAGSRVPETTQAREETDERRTAVAGGSTEEAATVGVSARDLEKLHDWLAHNRNDLAVINLKKEVVWNEWEALATNIKHQIRQAGFTGIISVRRTEEDNMIVYKNRPWANFMHSRTTKVLCALSLLGWFIYQPYMWLRYQSTTVVSRYRVDVSVGQYWSLIVDKIGPDGFDSGDGARNGAQ